LEHERLRPANGFISAVRRSRRSGWSPVVDGVDDLGWVDPVKIDGRDAKVDVAELALDHVQGTRLRAISTACAWRSWCGANRRRMPALVAMRHRWFRAAGGRPWPSPSLAVAHAEERPHCNSTRRASNGRSCSKPNSPSNSPGSTRMHSAPARSLPSRVASPLGEAWGVRQRAMPAPGLPVHRQRGGERPVDVVAEVDQALRPARSSSR